MINLIVIVVFLVLGILLQNVKQLPKETSKFFNWIVIQVCLPALALYYIPKIEWSNQLLYPILVAWIIFLFSWLFFGILAKRFRWSKSATGCLIICGGLSNTSFLGFPIITALYGESGMKTAILVDQPGSFVVLSTLGVLVATLYADGSTTGLQILKKITLFPPFITFVIACVMNVCNYDLLPNFQQALKIIGMGVTPLAMLSVGLQLHFESKSTDWAFLKWGLLYKLFIAPAIIFLLYIIVLQQHSQVIQVSLLEGAMAPMITGCILAASYNLQPKLCSMMIGFGIPISFITLFFWYWIVQFV